MKRKGFTLVELLIVIVVIGILSAMMMMSSSEAVSSSRATQIAANMRNLQTAALAYWADNMSKFNKTNPDKPDFKGEDANKKYVVDYLKDDAQSDLSSAYKNYDLSVANNNSEWYISYTFSTSDGDTDQVKEKVAGRAASLGLIDASSSTASVYTKSKGVVYLRVR